MSHQKTQERALQSSGESQTYDRTLHLDNEPAFVGNGNGNNTFQFPLWNAQNLSNAQHTAVITNIPTTQGKFLDIDYISIGRELGPPGFTGSISTLVFDDESLSMTYSPPGSWMLISDFKAFDSTLHQTPSVSLSFQGSSIEIYGLYVNAPFQVYLDSQSPLNLAGPNIDLNSQQEHEQTLLYLADGLNENETHTLTLFSSIANPGRPLFIDYAIVRRSQNFSDVIFTIPATLSPTTSKSMTGAIAGGVVGGIAGLATISFIGFIFLRHWKSSRFTNAARIDLFSPVISEIGPIESTPFVVPGNTGLFSTKESSSLPVSVPRAALASDSPQEGTVQVGGQQVSDMIRGSPNQPYTNMSMQNDIMEEEDAGPFEHSTLPPRYNDDWLGAIAR
ncbi:hypothetical protein Clacol_000042 [Clathrus columnatus]|uniref:Peptidase A1 domain-containing protein n=1 Tax=Clathrus columnatus TaxID=1419009 RepID=A0AAV4ZYW7_9AGAM|nr:hypothetical protein Clacol_000042 [Clathrus columnatus]